MEKLGLLGITGGGVKHAATVENGLAILHEVKRSTTMRCSNDTSGYISPEELKARAKPAFTHPFP